MDGRLVGLWRLHVVQISARVRRLRHKRHFFKEKRTAALVDDGVAQNDGVADDVHFGGYGQRLADSEAEVSAVRRSCYWEQQRREQRRRVSTVCISFLLSPPCTTPPML